MLDQPSARSTGDARLRLALALARRGGQRAAAARGRAHIAWKGPGDRVTDVDVVIQSQLVDRIRACFPGDGIVAEEGLAAIPCSAVSVGILRHGLPDAGVVRDPNTGFTCWAVLGEGAAAGERPIVLSGQPLTAASNVAVRVPLDPDLAPVVTQWLRRHKLRGCGSVALHLAYAAIGAIDVVLDHTATLCDIAAGALVLREAGGTITDPHGQPLFPPDAAAYRGAPMPSLAGNPSAHAEALAECRAHLAAPLARPR
jgi:myo-inositol-1(or 4)-monophosphatase